MPAFQAVAGGAVAQNAARSTMASSNHAPWGPTVWPHHSLKESARGGALARRLGSYNVSSTRLQESPLPPPEQRLKVPLRWALDEMGVRRDGSSNASTATVPGSGDSLHVRYWVVEDSFDRSDPFAPIFLGVGGEGGVHVRCPPLADRFGALCVLAEHRFYGESWPANASLQAFKAG